MIGTLNILTNPDKVLFDTGATTSFIFEEFYDKFGIRREMLENPMTEDKLVEEMDSPIEEEIMERTTMARGTDLPEN